MSDELNQLDLLDLEIESLLSLFMNLTSTKALQYLGMPVREDDEVKKDLEKARLSIDITAFLVEKLEHFLDDEEKRKLKQVVSNLQFTYIRESSE